MWPACLPDVLLVCLFFFHCLWCCSGLLLLPCEAGAGEVFHAPCFLLEVLSTAVVDVGVVRVDVVGDAELCARGVMYAACRAVVDYLTSYFYNRPVRIWPICRREGAVGTYSPRCRGQWSYNIPWPLACTLWWGENWPGGAPGTDPPKTGVLECASRPVVGPWRMIQDRGIRFVSITY
jgi:hypothetical protein